MAEFYLEYGYWGLFVASFLAATIVPIGSEVVFSALIVSGFDLWTCVIVGGIGNWLGGMLNYLIGMMGKVEWAEKYLKIKPQSLQKMQDFVQKKGAGIAIFCFLPIFGDLIALALGFLRANIYIVSIAMFFGKLLRYVLLGLGINWII